MRADLGLTSQPEHVRQRYEAQSVYLHPMIVRHPDNGRRSLFANPMFTIAVDRLSARESKMLLHFLYTEAPDLSLSIVIVETWEILSFRMSFRQFIADRQMCRQTALLSEFTPG